MTRVRLGAVGYLNARPHVFGLERMPRFDLRFDVPSQCAALLHDAEIDVGLIPSIEYLHGSYAIVPDVAIASRGPVSSVMLYTTRPLAEVRSIALDTSSRTSVALTRILCAREFHIQPRFEPHSPDLESMLAHNDAALIIGDQALFTDTSRLTGHSRQLTVLHEPSTSPLRPSNDGRRSAEGQGSTGGQLSADGQLSTVNCQLPIETIDLGEVWTRMTGLPFVYAFWAGRPEALTPGDVLALQQARDAGVERIDEIARQYFPGAPARQEVGVRYLRDNIKYHLGLEERLGLELFYRYAAEEHVVPESRELRFV
jgi:chorismate dehydratase